MKGRFNINDKAGIENFIRKVFDERLKNAPEVLDLVLDDMADDMQTRSMIYLTNNMSVITGTLGHTSNKAGCIYIGVVLGKVTVVVTLAGATGSFADIVNVGTVNVSNVGKAGALNTSKLTALLISVIKVLSSDT